MEHADVDAGLLESIRSMTVEELVALQADVEHSGAAPQLRAMIDCVRHFADEQNLPQLLVV